MRTTRIARALCGLLMIVLFGMQRFVLAQNSVAGRWDASVTVGTAEVPFRFEIADDGGNVRGFFFEGEKPVSSTSGKFVDGALQLEYEFLNATLKAKFDGRVLNGSYRYNRKNGKEYAFHAARPSATPANEAHRSGCHGRLGNEAGWR